MRSAPASRSDEPPLLPCAKAMAAPMNGANANTEPVRAAPNSRCASRYSRRLNPYPTAPIATSAKADERAGGAAPNANAQSEVAMVPRMDLPSTTWAGSRSASDRDRVLSTPHARVAPSTANMPKNCDTPSACLWSRTRIAPPRLNSANASLTLRSSASAYIMRARTTVNTASSVSMSEAAMALVRLKPQTRSTGPIAAPQSAISESRGISRTRTRASAEAGRNVSALTHAAPPYSNAAAQKLLVPAEYCWTSGVLAPNKTAAPSASRPPRNAGLAGLPMEGARSGEHGPSYRTATPNSEGDFEWPNGLREIFVPPVKARQSGTTMKSRPRKPRLIHRIGGFNRCQMHRTR